MYCCGLLSHTKDNEINITLNRKTMSIAFLIGCLSSVSIIFFHLLSLIQTIVFLIRDLLNIHFLNHSCFVSIIPFINSAPINAITTNATCKHRRREQQNEESEKGFHTNNSNAICPNLQ